ncbi:DUF2490 domain-containing protein [Deminuibacter soli]|uniref:DUF2490 domain-containing protein n=1 Tax=Deminuibacter soli TaxID=2291815 RepID=A0A3E1NH97_9BACT|nr:DUF2490 domain-containing protein [Deminuibacter soli]RFM27320.1 DUF2490 domain-containing protein [Deminuibacter soli]
MKSICLLLCCIFLLAAPVLLCAQDTSGTNEQLWPELDAYYRINNQYRIVAKISGTRQKNSDYSDGSFSLFGDYFTKARYLHEATGMDSTSVYALWLRAGYMYSASPPSSKDPFREHTLVGMANNRFYFLWKLMGTLRNRLDIRFTDGDVKFRYRPRFMLERDMHTAYLTFTAYVYAEYFFNLGQGELNRLRICGGAELKVTRILSFETYWFHQFGNKPEVQKVNAIGVSLKAYLKSKKVTN